MPEYRDQVEVEVELVRDWRTERQIPVIEVTNNGDQVISLMSLRLVIQDDERVPVEELSVYAATPLAVESEWRGPLMPGSKRRFKAGHIRGEMFDELAVSWEICELRVWDPRSPSGLVPPPLPATLASTEEPALAVPAETRIELTDETREALDLEAVIVEESATTAPDRVDDTLPDDADVRSLSCRCVELPVAIPRRHRLHGTPAAARVRTNAVNFGASRRSREYRRNLPLHHWPFASTLHRLP